MPIRLLLACRDRDVAIALQSKLVQCAGGLIECEPTDLDQALSRSAAIRPDVLLLEHDQRNERTSWQLLSQLRQSNREPRLLLLCENYAHVAVIGFVQRGVDGYVLKSNDPFLTVKAVIAVHSGETWFGRGALLQALRSQIASEPFGDSGWPAEEQEALTQREREILGLIGTAMSNKEIARKLQISDKTVKTHLHHIYVKLNQSGRYKAFLSNVAPVPSEYPAGHAGPAQ